MFLLLYHLSPLHHYQMNMALLCLNLNTNSDDYYTGKLTMILHIPHNEECDSKSLIGYIFPQTRHDSRGKIIDI